MALKDLFIIVDIRILHGWWDGDIEYCFLEMIIGGRVTDYVLLEVNHADD